MQTLAFKDLSFREEKSMIEVTLYEHFYFFIEKKELEEIGKFKIEKNSISFEASEKKAAKFNFILFKAIRTLKSRLTGKPAVYVHKNSSIPLIGNNAFGIVDRGTNIIEVKPVTGCNLNCIYCSVDQGKRETDFVVEASYLADVFKEVVKFKGCNNIEAHIGTQGEPLLYAPLAELVNELSKIKEVNIISIDTNGTLLSRKKIDELKKAGLTRINLSINAIDDKTAKKIAGCNYSVEHVKEAAKYAAQVMDLIIAPVWVSGNNDDELSKIIELAKGIKNNKHSLVIGIQNFLNYKFGKNPVKQETWEKYYEMLKKLEQKHGVKLILSEKDFSIEKTKELPKPFEKGDIVKAEVVCNGRLKGEKIAVAKGRTISVPKCSKAGLIKVRITRSKHNVFVGEMV